MTPSALLQLLAEVERGSITSEAAASRLSTLPFEDLGHSRIDHHRSFRTGLPEVIYAAGKTPEQTVAIFSSLAADGVDVLATRVDRATADAVLAQHPDASYNATAHTVSFANCRNRPKNRRATWPSSVPAPAISSSRKKLLSRPRLSAPALHVCMTWESLACTVFLPFASSLRQPMW